MAFELPRQRITPRQIQTQKRHVPIEQIIAVQGQSPVGAGIETLGNVIGSTLTKRAELRRQGEQLAQLAALTGQQVPADSTLSPEQYITGIKTKSEIEKNSLDRAMALQQAKAEAQKEARGEGKRTFIGNNTQGVPVFTDEQGNLSLHQLPGGGPVFPKNDPQKLRNEAKDIEDQLEQVQSLRAMLSDVPAGAAGGIQSLASKATFGAIGGKSKQYNDLKPAIATKIYRATTGDTRLSDADAAARAYPLLPDLAEPLEVREAKLQNIEKILSQRQQRLLGSNSLIPIEPRQPTAISPRKIGGYLIEEE